MFPPSLASLDQEHFGLAGEDWSVSCPESFIYFSDGEGLPIGPWNCAVHSVTQNTADEGISMFRSLLEISESTVRPLHHTELWQLRRVAERSEVVQCLIHLVLGLVFTHQDSEPEPAEHLSQTFCRKMNYKETKRFNNKQTGQMCKSVNLSTYLHLCWFRFWLSSAWIARCLWSHRGR